MASKEATVYIVDLGRSMGKTSDGREETDLDWALEYVWDKITTTVATDRKTALIGVVGLKTDGTSNMLDSEEAYQHITVLQDLKQVLMPDIRHLREQFKCNGTDEGDLMSALVIAIQMITAQCKQLQYVRRIVLVTNGLGVMDIDDLESIADKIKSDKMELVILGVDFNDPDYGFKEDDKDPSKAKNEQTLRKLANECDGAFGTLAQAIDELSIPRMKTVRPVHSFKGYLTLGNPEVYDTAMAIDIERYPRTMVAKPPTASSFVIRSDMAGSATQPTSTMPGEVSKEDGLAGVKNYRTYQVADDSAPGKKRDVEQENLAKGYAYGSTAVYIAESDRNVTTFESKPGLDIVGFVAREKYERYLDMSRTNVIIAQRTNDKAAMALSSFIHALYELESYAVARLVVKEDKQPLMLLLTPSIEPDIECLYDVELPFAEDVRSYHFPPLDRIPTVSGKELKTHRNLPSDALKTAMSDYVDSMDLSNFSDPSTGETAEYATIDDTFSPVLHRVNHVIRHRAIFPSAKDLPPIADTLTKYSHPPASLVSTAQPHLDAILAAADIKKVDPKLRGRRARKQAEAPKPLSGLDVSALLSTPGADAPRSRISASNAVPEFIQALQAAASTGAGISAIENAGAQLGDIVRGYIQHSVGESGYGRALEAMGVLREYMADYETPGVWNEFLRTLKKDLLAGDLGGDRDDMWFKIRQNRLGLITRKEVGVSEVGDDEGKEFLRPK